MKRLLFPILVILMMTTGCTCVADIVEVVNQPPTAYIDSISPTDASVGETVAFDGHGTDLEGTVVAYRWRSSLDGDLSAKASFDTSSLSAGEHTIYFKVQDNTGAWSDEVRSRVTVSAGAAAAPVINSFGASPGSIASGASSTLSWNVSNATARSIDKGVGAVAATGTTAVSPVMTTQYTLTATNAAGSATATTQVIVSGAPPPGLPVISSFIPNPPAITAGDSSTLSWSVSNATNVTIDQGVGAVAPVGVGSVSVSPAATTSYTLTATNAAGWSSFTITVLVDGVGVDTTPPTVPVLSSPAPGATLPQQTMPWVFDWADSSDPESGIKRYQIQVFRPLQPPFIEEYAVNSEYSDTVEVAYPYIVGWKWKVRAQNNADLWSDWSAERTFDVEPRVAYDFVEMAPTAFWWSQSQMGGLTFGPPDTNPDGFALYRNNITLNDGHTYARVLETHPNWVDFGWISGRYSGIPVPDGARLKVKVGFISGASAGEVKFRLGKLGDAAVIQFVSAYADGVQEAEASLAAYAGQTIDFCLGVNAEGNSAQDWAVWIETKMVY